MSGFFLVMFSMITLTPYHHHLLIGPIIIIVSTAAAESTTSSVLKGRVRRGWEGEGVSFLVVFIITAIHFIGIITVITIVAATPSPSVSFFVIFTSHPRPLLVRHCFLNVRTRNDNLPGNSETGWAKKSETKLATSLRQSLQQV